MHTSHDQQLAGAYVDLLTSFDLTRFRPVETGLAGIFLPSAPLAPVKLMIVGQETRGWLGSFEKVYDAPLHEYVVASMARHRNLLAGPPKGSKFGQFHRQAQRKLNSAEGSVAWHNLFSISFKESSPTASKAMGLIAELSAQLLLKQIELLQPHAILFVTGAGYDRYLKACFDGRIQNSCVVVPKRLWRFRMGDTLCLRATHPRFPAGNPYRMQALQEVADELAGARVPFAIPQSDVIGISAGAAVI
ncbi:hypothetical protein C3E98_011565 [Pseudomonas sp. MWU13-2625]|jgi:hypothetical protein|nr:hypothetical protein C3E98_011565 [Pseudomonas sp. MWU13-2625]